MMIKEPVVSVIMPIYNASEFLKDSVGDVLAQTFKDFELICVNDGSTDTSGEILSNLAKDDERITVIEQKNAGGGAARNRGMQEAKGKYLLFLDADDRFESELIELAVEKAEETHADIVAYDGDIFDHKTGEHKAAPWLIKKAEDEIGENPFETLNTTVWNKLFLHEYIKKNKIYFQENNTINTMYFSFISVLYSDNIALIRKVLVHYRTNNIDSTNLKSDKYPLEALDAFKCLKKKMEDDGVFKTKKAIFKIYAAEYMINKFKLIKTAEGYSALYKALHQGGLEELGFERGGDSDAGHFSEEIDYIMSKNLETFLYDRWRRLHASGLLCEESYMLPSIDEQNRICNIIIYGGGNVGRDFFRQAMQRPEYNIISWVDKNYKKIGFPLCAPEDLKNMEFDTVIIAVLDKKIADAIIRDLKGLGVSDEKIFWRRPEIA